ncbi:hypothetical protein EVAR_78661_1 [Eumeta japonica]|uniref:Uncharacterized protein n=1 Tax=Eumeta variegata TaxID=151549 RepID=A0A4C1U976_EUMVA|nr:hypothetical protein EVAR_78661_1 [Eumeta japonica]
MQNYPVFGCVKDGRRGRRRCLSKKRKDSPHAPAFSYPALPTVPRDFFALKTRDQVYSGPMTNFLSVSIGFASHYRVATQ